MKISSAKKNKLYGIITLVIEKDDYEHKVTSVLKKYSKTASIPGFRKGFVPLSLIKKQYGRAVKVDEINKLVDTSLKKFINDEKLDLLGGPIPSENNNLDWTSDSISFDFEIGYSPEFKLNLKPKKPIIQYEITPDKKNINDQIKNIQARYGKLISKSKIKEKYEITGSFFLNDEMINESIVFTTDILKPSFSKKVLGLTIGKEIEEQVSKIFKDSKDISSKLKIESTEKEKLKKVIKVRINEINEREPAELNQDLFDKIFRKDVVKNVSEFKNKLSEDFIKQFQTQTNQKLMNDTIEFLISSIKIDLPKDFLTRWIQLNSDKKITLDEAKEEYKKSEKGMKYQLIESKIIVENKMQVNFDDLKKYTSDLIKIQMQQYGQSVPNEKDIEQTVARVMSNKEEVKRLTEQLSGERMLNFFKENVLYKSKKLTYDQFIKEAYQV
jgi:trigger factor